MGQKVQSLATGCEHDVVIFSKSYCPFCRRAKRLLEERGIKFCAIELDQTADGNMIQLKLLEMTGQRTVRMDHCATVISCMPSVMTGALDLCPASGPQHLPQGKTSRRQRRFARGR